MKSAKEPKARIVPRNRPTKRARCVVFIKDPQIGDVGLLEIRRVSGIGIVIGQVNVGDVDINLYYL
jgi:hypothetical protein